MSEKSDKPNNKETLPQPNTETVTLNNPIMRGEQEITSISIRKPKAGALRGLKLAELLNLDVDSVIKVVPRISTPSLTEHEVADLEADDLVQVSTAVIGFFAPEKKAELAQS